MIFKTKNIFKNSKTGYAVDFGVCGLMAINNGKYSAPKCEKCYAVNTINMYPNVKRKIESITNNLPLLSDFEADILKIAKTGQRFIRFYALGDLGSNKEIEYIAAASKILPVELFSKTLHEFHRHLIPIIGNLPNVRLSLSFNKNYSANYIETLWNFLKVNHLLTKVQLNYTFIDKEVPRLIPYISVYHTTSKDKVALKNLLGKNRICCAKTEDGKEVMSKDDKGHCFKCALCRLPASNAKSEIITPRILKEIYA